MMASRNLPDHLSTPNDPPACAAGRPCERRHLLARTAPTERPGKATDEYNNQRRDWSNPDRVEWPARLEQLAGREVTFDQQTQVADWIAYLAATPTFLVSPR
jgi:hypothetical protein